MMSLILSALEAVLPLQTMVSYSLASGPRSKEYYFCSKFHLDSVEDGDKVVKTAIDNFGRVGKPFSQLASW